jgi:hypothetical protein
VDFFSIRKERELRTIVEEKKIEERSERHYFSREKEHHSVRRFPGIARSSF